MNKKDLVVDLNQLYSDWEDQISELVECKRQLDKLKDKLGDFIQSIEDEEISNENETND